MRLTRARIWQLPRLATILWAFTRATPWLPCMRRRDEDLRALLTTLRRGWVRVALLRGRVAGFIVRDGSRVHALYVAPGARGRGIGRALLTEAKATAGALELWVLEANGAALAFYASEGFAEAARAMGGGNDEGLPDILMIWRQERAPL